MESSGRSRLRSLIGPGLLVAATGVGAGDLATGAFAGNKVGLAVLWAVAVGAILKFVLNEGLARWQLATGETLLEGATRRFGLIFPVIFLLYFVVWSFLVALALMSACGVTAHAMIPVFEDAGTAKIVFGIVHSLLGVALVLAGGYGLFEKVMRVCIGGMFAVVVVTAIMLWPGTSAVVQGLFVPASETLEGQKLDWTVALLGGVGGTVTVLCYGYWLREENREGLGEVSSCRTDLAVAYVMTALFGIAMVIIGNSVELPEGKGATLIVRLADRLDEPLGTAGKWAFLIGAWGAVFSSLLGVWQAVPYLFGDLCRLLKKDRAGDGSTNKVSTKSPAYRAFLAFLALAPLYWLTMPFSTVQKFYAIWGAFFIPFLAFVLLVLCNRKSAVGDAKNRILGNAMLVVSLAFFAWVFVKKLLPLFEAASGS